MGEREILRLEMWGTVQKLWKMTGATGECASLNVMCIWKLGLRADVTYISLCQPCVSKNTSPWKSMSAGKRGHLPRFPKGTCHLVLDLDAQPFLSSHTVNSAISKQAAVCQSFILKTPKGWGTEMGQYHHLLPLHPLILLLNSLCKLHCAFEVSGSFMPISDGLHVNGIVRIFASFSFEDQYQRMKKSCLSRCQMRISCNGINSQPSWLSKREPGDIKSN